MQTLVRLKNNGDTTVSLPYHDSTQNNRQEMVTFEPGEEKIVPWDVLILFCGDPNVTNKEYWRERDEAVESIHLLYGALTLAGPNSSKLPKMEAYTLDGDRITTLIDDMAGVSIVPEADDTTDVGRLQAQIEALQAEVRKSQDAPEQPDTEGETVDVEDIPVDKPTRAKVRR
jgi:hypothetical protein